MQRLKIEVKKEGADDWLWSAWDNRGRELIISEPAFHTIDEAIVNATWRIDFLVTSQHPVQVIDIEDNHKEGKENNIWYLCHAPQWGWFAYIFLGDEHFKYNTVGFSDTEEQAREKIKTLQESDPRIDTEVTVDTVT